MVVILMVGFNELGNPAARGVTLSLGSHLRLKTSNIHRTSHDDALIGTIFISPVYTLRKLHYTIAEAIRREHCDFVNH
jgi:hypothetical protein